MSKVILFISAFVPMYILFLINLVMELINKNLRLNLTNRCVLIGLVVLIIIGFVGLIIVIHSKDKEYKNIKIISKKNVTDQHFLNYFSLFVLLALTFDLSKISFICVFFAIMLFIGVVYIRNNIYYVNPLLNIMGYSFYDIEYIDGRKKKQVRIFYKGELEVFCDYKLFNSNKNLKFVEKIK